MTVRMQSLGEEIAKSVSHGVTLVAAIVGVPFPVLSDSHPGMVGVVVFATTVVLLYLTSTLYHALPAGRAKHVFLKRDHDAIYLFIAGRYTPFALGALHRPWGWILFGTVWPIAVNGIVLKASDRLSHSWLSTGLYLITGWLVLIAAAPLEEQWRQPASRCW